MNENQLFFLLKTRLIPDLEKTDQFNPKDAYSKKHKLAVELKCRYAHYEDLLIEKAKYDQIILNENVRYITSTPLGVYSFDLHNLPEPEWIERELPASTMYHRENEYIIKWIGYLNINDAKNITKLLIF